MKKAELPFLADWFAISFRWFNLLGITIALTTAGSLIWPVTAGLIFAAIWNVIMSLLATINVRMPNHRFINLCVDIFVSLTLYNMVGGLVGPLTWAGLLAILTAAIYYEWRGGLLAAIFVFIIQFGLSYLASFQNDPTPILIPMGVIFVFNLTAGIIFGLSSKRLMKGLRYKYFSEMKQRQNLQQIAQKQERGRMKVFYQLIETLSSTLNYEVVLNTTLDLSQKTFDELGKPTEMMTSAVLLFKDDKLLVANARRFSPTDLKRTFKAAQGILYDTIQSGEPQICSDPAQDPELKSLLALQACKQAITLPLARGLDAYGVMMFAHPIPNYFTNEKIELLSMISSQSVIAIQNALLYQQLQLEKEAIIDSQEEAQKKLARDLHDGPTQSVSAIAMRLNIARKMMEMAPEKLADELERIENSGTQNHG